MNSYEFTPQAADDLFEIWVHIARDNIEAANRVEDAVLEGCVFVAQVPLAGQMRRDLTNLPVRFWTIQRYPNYRIVYDPETTPVQIVRVLHGARNLPLLLR